MMSNAKGGAARRALAALAGALVALVLAGPAARAAAAEPPPEVRQVLELLANPAVQEWLARHDVAQPAQAEAPSATAAPSRFLATHVEAARAHLSRMAAAIPTLPAELGRAAIILELEFEERGLIRLGLLIVAFVALGFIAEQIFHRSMARPRRWLLELTLGTVAERLQAVTSRLAYGTGMVVAFAIGSVGAFLAFDWPPLLREIVAGYLTAFLATRLALVAGRFLLAPGAERFRVVPMSTAAAAFWHRNLGIAVGWLAFCWVTLVQLGTLGVPPDARHVLAYLTGLVLLAIGLNVAFRRPRDRTEAHRSLPSWLPGAFLVLLWLLWVANAMALFWTLVVAVGLPAAMGVVRRSVGHILRPAGAPDAEAETPSLAAVILERGLRAAVIIGAAFILAWAWNVDFGALTAQDTLVTRVARGLISATVVVLLTDLVWHVARALIDRRLASVAASSRANDEDARRQARLRTLLPILRNLVFVVLMVMAALMVLSSVGIEIGPLIAGAGVVGVAIGFGAQTLVKDIISGMFFLLDDAFRVGEYVQSGAYKGTVESFSLRSVKLRHHRGPLFTVPFGELGAIQNMSRDWVIDKLTLALALDTDLDKVKKIVKQVGKDLLADAECAPHILETLKMQGVETFGDQAVTIRMKMMTKPGEQFVIRRKAYALIKKAFDAAGVAFATTTVHVAGGEVPAAAARRALAETASPGA